MFIVSSPDQVHLFCLQQVRSLEVKCASLEQKVVRLTWGYVVLVSFIFERDLYVSEIFLPSDSSYSFKGWSLWILFAHWKGLHMFISLYNVLWILFLAYFKLQLLLSKTNSGDGFKVTSIIILSVCPTNKICLLTGGRREGCSCEDDKYLKLLHILYYFFSHKLSNCT